MVYLNQYFIREEVPPEIMDRLWASGWRHFGSFFFRYSLAIHGGRPRMVIPLRVDLSRFSPSRSQKRILRRNSDLRVEVAETVIDDRIEGMFERHKQRFEENIPDSIHDFLSAEPARVPCLNRTIAVYDGERLVAASFLDIGCDSTSAVYAVFEPSESRRSLGIFTILRAIRHSREIGCSYYYPGYAYTGSSVYDYKKGIGALERYDWNGGWEPYSIENEPKFPGPVDLIDWEDDDDDER